MRRNTPVLRLTVVGVLAAAGLGSIPSLALAADPAQPASTTSSSAVQLTAATGAGFTLTIDSAGTVSTQIIAGKSQEMNAAGIVIADGTPQLSLSTSNGVSANSTIGTYNCVVKTNQNSNFRGYTPVTWYQSGNSYSSSWTFHPYSIDNARYLYNSSGIRYATFQLEDCFSGGGTSWNSWHQWYNVGSTTTSKSRIGSTWAQGTTSDGTATSTLSFTVSAGPVKIGATTTITPGAGTNTGSTGHDPNESYYPYSSSYDPNRVNANWQSAHTFIWDGTGSFIGNNGHALWEMPENSKTTTLYNYIGVQFLCGAIFGSCAPLQ